MLATAATTCSHPRLKATDYDESYHWVVVCKDCAWRGTMTQQEWRRRLLSHGLGTAKIPLIVDAGKDESGRVEISRVELGKRH